MQVQMEPSRGTPPKARTVNLWRYVVIVYFLICGGPFGIEVAVSAAGPLPTLIGFFAMPFLWSFPQVWAVLPTAAGACALAYTHLKVAPRCWVHACFTSRYSPHAGTHPVFSLCGRGGEGAAKLVRLQRPTGLNKS